MFRKATRKGLIIIGLLSYLCVLAQPQEGFVQLGWYNGILQTARHSYETKPIHVAVVYNVRLSNLMEYNGWKEVDELIRPYTIVHLQSVRNRFYPDNVEIVTRGDIEETLAHPPEGKTVIAPDPGKGNNDHLYPTDTPQQDKGGKVNRYADANPQDSNKDQNYSTAKRADGKIQPSISVRPLPPSGGYTQNNSVKKGAAVGRNNPQATPPLARPNPNPPPPNTNTPILAETEATEQEKEIKLGQHFGFVLGGFIEADHISYFKNQPGQINGRNQGTISLDISALPTSKINWFANIEYLEDLSDNTRTGLRLDELYIDLPIEQWRFRLGKQIINWYDKDNTNRLRPYPLTSPRDFTDYLEPAEYRGALALEALFQATDHAKVEFFLAPEFVADKLPQTRSRWTRTYPDSIPNPFNEEGVYYDASYAFMPVEVPQEKKAQFGARISNEFERGTIGTYFYKGWNYLPNMQKMPQYIPPDSVHFLVNTTYTPLSIFGLDFEVEPEQRNLLFGNLAYFNSESQLYQSNEFNEIDTIQDHFLRYSIGMQHGFELDYNQIITASIQWLHDAPLGKQQYQGYNLQHIYQRAMLLNFSFFTSKKHELALRISNDFQTKDIHLQPRGHFHITDSIQLTVLMDFLGGQSMGFWGNYRQNDRFQVKIEKRF